MLGAPVINLNTANYFGLGIPLASPPASTRCLSGLARLRLMALNVVCCEPAHV